MTDKYKLGKDYLMAHLVRPGSAEGSDKVYLHQVMEVHPELADHVREYIYDEASDTENLIVDALVLDFPKVQKALFTDCRFTVHALIDKTFTPEKKQSNIKAAMEKILEVAES